MIIWEGAEAVGMKTETRKPFVLAAIALAALMVSLPADAQERIGDFGLYDQDGDFHQLSRLKEGALLLIVPVINEDPVSREVLRQINALSARFGTNGVFATGLNATDHSREDIQNELLALDLQMPVLMDSAGIVSKTLKANRTGEVFLINSDGFALLYRGPVHQSAGREAKGIANTTESLEKAILKAIAGNSEDTVFIPYSEGLEVASGQIAGSRAYDVSYQDDIVPILEQRCASCHIEGGLAPWAMNSHRMIQGWSPMIREVLMTRRMPPDVVVN